MVEKRSKKGTEKHPNLQCKQCTRESEPKADGMEEEVQVGACRNCSTVERVKKERIVLERDSEERTKRARERWQR